MSSTKGVGSNNQADALTQSYRTLGDGSVAQAAVQYSDASYNGISTATTTVVKPGAGQLVALVILGGTLGAITVYDNTAASGTAIVPTYTPVAMVGNGPQVVPLGVAFSTGLTIVTAAATVLVAVYR